MFDGSAAIQDALRRKVHALAQRARIIRLSVLPVVGAVQLAMEQVGIQPSDRIRMRISQEACARG